MGKESHGQENVKVKTGPINCKKKGSRRSRLSRVKTSTLFWHLPPQVASEFRSMRNTRSTPGTTGAQRASKEAQTVYLFMYSIIS